MNKNNGARMVSAFKLIAWAVLAVGCLVFLVNVNDFNSGNLGLMIGIGMIISGMQIYGFGVVVQLLHSKPINERREVPKKQDQKVKYKFVRSSFN